MNSLSRPITLNGFQEMCRHIYDKVNDEMYQSFELIMRVFEEASELMELARKDLRTQIPGRLARVYAWTNAVANRLDISLEGALWHKYPGVCSYCLRDENCVCGLEHPVLSEEEKEVFLRRKRRETMGAPHTIREYQELHKRLYAKQNERIMLIQTVAHLAEEVGEVSRAFRHSNVEKVEEEIADVISWIFATATRLDIDFEEVFWIHFPYECEACCKDTCRCEKKY